MNTLALMLISFLRVTLINKIGNFIMKKILINWLLPVIYDALIAALSGLSKKSDNTIDDMLVGTVIANREKILDEIKASL